MTFGLADKISAAVNTIADGGTYKDNLARERAINEQDNRNGYSRFIGQIAGGAALPIGRINSLAQAAGKGAAFGGAYSFNSSDEPFSQRVDDVLVGGGLGAAGGVAGYGVVQGIGRGVNAFRNRNNAGQGVSDNMNALLAGQRQNISMRQPDIRPRS